MNNGFAFTEENMSAKEQLLELAINRFKQTPQPKLRKVALRSKLSQDDRFRETGVVRLPPRHQQTHGVCDQNGDLHPRFNGVASLIGPWSFVLRGIAGGQGESAFPTRKESR